MLFNINDVSYEPDWERLAERVRRRRQFLNINQDAVPGVSKPTLSKIENAKQGGYKDFVVAALERALEWQPGSVERILAGEDPVEVDQPAPAPSDDIAEVLELARSMREGLEKSQSRDDKLSDIINLCEKISATQSALVCRVLENAARIEALLEHFDLEVDLEPSPSA